MYFLFSIYILCADMLKCRIAINLCVKNNIGVNFIYYPRRVALFTSESPENFQEMFFITVTNYSLMNK